MKYLLVSMVFLFLQHVYAIEAANTVKGLEGSSGQNIFVLEIKSDAKNGPQALVQYRGIGGELEGKTEIYGLQNAGTERQELFYEKKRGSKKDRLVVLAQRESVWTFSDPTRPGTVINLFYSGKLSKELSASQILESYQKQGEKK